VTALGLLEKLRQLGDVARYAPRLVHGEHLSYVGIDTTRRFAIKLSENWHCLMDEDSERSLTNSTTLMCDAP
jgi:hypothetical protein